MAIERLRVRVIVDDDAQPVIPARGNTIAVVGAANEDATEELNTWRFIELTPNNIQRYFGSASAGGATTGQPALTHPNGTDLPGYLNWLATLGVEACYAAGTKATTADDSADPVVLTKTQRSFEIELWQAFANTWASLGTETLPARKPTILTTFSDCYAKADGTSARGDDAAITDADALALAIEAAAVAINCRSMISTPNKTIANDLAWGAANNGERVFQIRGQATQPFSPGPAATYPVNSAPFVAAAIVHHNYWQRIANTRVKLGPQGADLSKRIGYGPVNDTDSSRLSTAHIAALVDIGAGIQLYGDRLGYPASEETDPRRFWHISHCMDFLSEYAANRYNQAERDDVGARQFVVGYIHGVNGLIRQHTKPARNNILDSGEIVINQEESDDNNLKFDMDLDFNTPAVDWEIRARITQ